MIASLVGDAGVQPRDGAAGPLAVLRAALLARQAALRQPEAGKALAQVLGCAHALALARHDEVDQSEIDADGITGRLEAPPLAAPRPGMRRTSDPPGRG